MGGWTAGFDIFGQAGQGVGFLFAAFVYGKDRGRRRREQASLVLVWIGYDKVESTTVVEHSRGLRAIVPRKPKTLEPTEATRVHVKNGSNESISSVYLTALRENIDSLSMATMPPMTERTILAAEELAHPTSAYSSDFWLFFTDKYDQTWMRDESGRLWRTRRNPCWDLSDQMLLWKIHDGPRQRQAIKRRLLIYRQRPRLYWVTIRQRQRLKRWEKVERKHFGEAPSGGQEVEAEQSEQA